MGTGADWLPVMDCLSITFRCISVDLPGHGQTTLEQSEGGKLDCSELREGAQNSISSVGKTGGAWSIEGLGEALTELLRQEDSEKLILVGYSMGARIALYMALRHSDQVIFSLLPQLAYVEVFPEERRFSQNLVQWFVVKHGPILS